MQSYTVLPSVDKFQVRTYVGDDKMRDNPILTKYSDDESYRYEIFDREDGTFEVWIQRKLTDDFMGKDCSSYCDISDYMHITDSVARAIEIGEEGLNNLV